MDRTPMTDFAHSQDFLGAGGGAPGEGRLGLVETRIEARARIRFTVAQALLQGRVAFHFQPVVRAGAPRFIAFHEMLARLRLPDGNILAAGAFLPLVMECEIGRSIDRLALTTALETLEGDRSLRLSINMSPLSMGDAEWLEILGSQRWKSARPRLILEITEDAAVEQADQTTDFMDHVRSLGCAFALDDFGAGATGFRHFREFRFDMVKLDGGFVQNVHRERDAQVLVECLDAVARHFDMMTVAERVETPEDAAWLADHGIDCFQGYLFGRPAAAPLRPDAAERDENRAAG